MKKYIIALFILTFSTVSVNYVVKTKHTSQAQLSIDNVEALACTVISENGPNGGWIWCLCTHDYVCQVNASKHETIYGYAQER